MTLCDLYSDNHHVATSLRDIESLRASAFNTGVMVSIAAFGLNEVARLTLRSRKYAFQPGRWRPAANAIAYLVGFDINRLLSFYKCSYVQA